MLKDNDHFAVLCLYRATYRTFKCTRVTQFFAADNAASLQDLANELGGGETFLEIENLGAVNILQESL